MADTDADRLLGVFEENRFLKAEVMRLRKELERFQRPPLVIAEVKEVFDGGKVVVKIPNGSEFLVEVSKSCGALTPGDFVALEQKNLIVVQKLGKLSKFAVERFVIIEKPKVGWRDIGGLNEQIREIREVVELPLKNPKLFRKIGITPPKGILLYGPPGTGKTLLAKSMASSTKAVFIEIVASELVQKFIGEGAKLVKEIFSLAREKAPAIIFIDELDAIAAQRVELGTSGEREVNRTFMQLLAEIDGFDPLGDVKIIGATNRIDVLDPAILRPGRLDRLIHVPLPDGKGRADIFKIHTREMPLREVDLNQLAKLTEGFSGADIKAVCTEAGYFAIRGKRNYVSMDDFFKAIKKVRREESSEGYKEMFG